MKTKSFLLSCGAALFWTSSALAGNAVDSLLTRYGAGPFDAAAGKAFWEQQYPQADGSNRSCGTCHGADLSKSGKHARTGKPIGPMAPSANAERFTDAAKVEKWFKRNCKWTLGRECTPGEKGNVLSYLNSL